MIKETVMAVNAAGIVTESGPKICIGNRSFDTGEDVWTEGQYAFGNERWGGQPVVVDGDGIVGDYFVVIRSPYFYIYDAGRLSYIIEHHANEASYGGYVALYNKAGTKFLAFPRTGQIGATETNVTYYELTESGIETKTLNVSGVVTDSGAYFTILDFYYDDDKLVFELVSNASDDGFEQVAYDGKGNVVYENHSTPTLYYCKFVDGVLEAKEAINEGAEKAECTTLASKALSMYKNCEIDFTDIIEPTQADIQAYWDSIGQGYTISDWTLVWKDDFIKDDESTWIEGNARRIDYKYFYPKEYSSLESYLAFDVDVKTNVGNGYGAIVYDRDYDATIGKLGFDDGSLDNYYIEEHYISSSSKTTYKSYYGPDVVVPTEAVNNYYVDSKWSQNRVYLCSYGLTRDLIPGANHISQSEGVVSIGLRSNTNYSLNGIRTENDRHYVMRTAKVTYNLTHNGTTEAKTVYWTRRANTITNITPDAEITPASLVLSQAYHSGWTLAYNYSTKEVTASKGGDSYSLGTYIRLQFVISNVPTLFDTKDYVMYFDRNNSKIVKIDKSTLERSDLLTSVTQPPMHEAYVLWRIPLAKLLFTLNQTI